MAGVVLISRWMDERRGRPGGRAGALAGGGARRRRCRTAAGAARARRRGRPDERRRRQRLIGLALLTAAGWGLGPVFIDLAATPTAAPRRP